MTTVQVTTTEPVHCVICGRELTCHDLQAGLGGGLLLCVYCRAVEESCGCEDGE